MMAIFAFFLSIIYFFLKYAKGFGTAEILERRMDNIQTVIFTLLVYSGLSPVFKFMTNVVAFFHNLVLSMFFPNKKLQRLEIHNAKQNLLEKQLLKKLDKIHQTQEKLTSKIEAQKVKTTQWQERGAK